MKKKIVLLTLIVAVALIFLSISSFADAKAHGNFNGKAGMSNQHMGPERNFSGQTYGQSYGQSQQNGDSRGMMNLDLSQEQQTQIRQIMLDFQKETLELRNQIQVKQLEIRELRLSSDVDLEQLRVKMEEIAQIQVELRMKSIERQEKVKEVLTPEQLENCGLGLSMQNNNFGNVGNNNSNQGFKGNRW
jgi:Spy/CpxP family protein refolding chaperone